MITSREYLLNTKRTDKYPRKDVRSNTCLSAENRMQLVCYPQLGEDIPTVIATKKRSRNKKAEV